MSALIELKDLSSFFELFVAYTFAYSNLSSVKDGVNKASVKDLDDKVKEYELQYIKESENANDISVVNKSSELSPLITTKVDELNKKVQCLRQLKQVTDIFYSGDFLRPIFYLTGATYLFFIILSAFQNYLGDLAVIIIINLLFLYITLYSCYYYYRYIYIYVKLDFAKIDWQFPTKKTLKKLLLATTLILVFSVFISLDKFCFTNFK